MNHLEIKHLRMLCTISETSNITKAAEKLYISQSALSQQLKDIEGKLGADLFFRSRKKMILTPIGKKLLKTAKHVISEIEDAELEIAKIISGDHGELKVGTQCIFCYKWLPHVMRTFQHKFPNIEFEIGNSGDALKELQIKKFDIIITAAAGIEENYTIMPLFEDQMVCIMAKDHPLSTQSFIQFEDFRKYSFISHAEKSLSKFYQLVLKPKGLEPKRFMTVGQPYAIIEMVAAGFGMSIFPRWAARNALGTSAIVALPITGSGLPVMWQAVYLKKNHIPLFQKEFINIVRNMSFEKKPEALVV